MAIFWYDGTDVFDFKKAIKKNREKGRKERGGKRGLHFSLVYTVYSPEWAKLKARKKPSAYTCISFCCYCVGVLYFVSYVYVNDILAERSFLAVLTRRRGGTDLCPPLARSPCSI